MIDQNRIFLRLLFGMLSMLFLLIIQFKTFGQEKSVSPQMDSLIQKLEKIQSDTGRYRTMFEIVLLAADQDRDLMLSYARKVVALAKKIDRPELIYPGYEKLGLAFILRTEYDSATYYLDKGEAYALSHGFAPYKIYNLQGYLFDDQGNYEAAVLIFQKAIKVLDSLDKIGLGDSQKFASIQVNLANIYLQRGDYEKSISIFKEVIRIGEETNDIYSLNSGNNNIGAAYAAAGRYDEALIHLSRSLSSTERIGDYFGWGNTKWEIGKIHALRGEYGKAETSFKEAINTFHDMKSDREELAVKLDLAQVHYELKEWDKAFQLAREVYRATENKVSINYLDAIRVLGQVCEEKGDFRKALKYQKEFAILSDSSNQLLYSNRILEFEKNLEFEKKEQEKQQLLADKEKADLLHREELRQQKIIQSFAFVGILLVGVIAFIQFRSYQRKRRDYQQLTEKNTEISRQSQELTQQNIKLQELSNYKQGLTQMIAHDMKNPLNTVINLPETNPSPRQSREAIQSGRVMLQLVTNMLDVQRFEDKGMVLKKEHLPLHVLIREARLQVGCYWYQKTFVSVKR